MLVIILGNYLHVFCLHFLFVFAFVFDFTLKSVIEDSNIPGITDKAGGHRGVYQTKDS